MPISVCPDFPMRTIAAGVIPLPANAKAGDYLLMVGVTLWRELAQSPASYLNPLPGKPRVDKSRRLARSEKKMWARSAATA